MVTKYGGNIIDIIPYSSQLVKKENNKQTDLEVHV